MKILNNLNKLGSGAKVLKIENGVVSVFLVETAKPKTKKNIENFGQDAFFLEKGEFKKQRLVFDAEFTEEINKEVFEEDEISFYDLIKTNYENGFLNMEEQFKPTETDLKSYIEKLDSLEVFFKI